MEGLAGLADTCRRYLSEKGRLSTAIPGFVAREPQSCLAVAIAEAILNQSLLVAEAGTGTGKTFAYLLPCLLSGKRVLISTATKTLQDQLVKKDLPLLVNALGLSRRMQNLKGRSNYICRYRTQLHAKEGAAHSPQSAQEITYIQEKMAQLTEGDRGELPEISETSGVWPYVTSTTENCLGGECPEYGACFLAKARKRAMEANVVVINHHVFFADSRLKEGGFGELLPGFDVVVFDEAHQLPEIAVQFHGVRVGTRELQNLVDDVLAEWPVLDLANQPIKRLSLQADSVTDKLLSSLPTGPERLSFEEVARNKAFMDQWAELLKPTEELKECLQSDSVKDIPGLVRCKARLEDMAQFFQSYNGSDSHTIPWLERFKNTLVFNATPYDVADVFSEQLARQACAYVFTSATLTMGDSFQCFTKQLGLQAAKTVLLPSPFDFQTQALLYLPRGMPDPKHSDYCEALVNNALPVIEACGGRCFFLFTSHRALKQVASLLSNTVPYPLLIQGEEAKPILLAKFRQLGNAVLLGTATFWEGVDVKGEALSCVIIDKLPFASPADPVMRARLAYLKARGMSAFDELSLPNAVIALKQGVGRLIRDAADCGVLMIADPRLWARPYGQMILSSLPKCPKTRDVQRVVSFIHTLELSHEPAST